MPRLIHKRGDGYLVRVQISRSANGKKVYVNRTCRTKKEADAVVAQLKYERNSGALVQPSKITVAEYLHAWLETIKPNVRARTQSGYADTVRLYLKPELGGLKLSALTRQHV